MSRDRILELRAERASLEARLSAISDEVDGCVEVLLADGWSGSDVAKLCGWSKQRVSQLRKRVEARTAAEWGAYRLSPAERRRAALDAFAFARDAQEARAERYSLGYAEERRAFFGDPRVAAPACDAESPVRFAGMYEPFEAELARMG